MKNQNQTNEAKNQKVRKLTKKKKLNTQTDGVDHHTLRSIWRGAVKLTECVFLYDSNM